MRLSELRIVLRKELLDTLRDRRTWRRTLVMPLMLVPLLMIAMSMGVTSQNRALTEPQVPLAVVGSEHGPNLISFLETGGDFQILPVGDAGAALCERVARVCLVIPPGLNDRTAQVGRTVLETHFDSTDARAVIIHERLVRSLDGFARAEAISLLQQQGFDPSLLQPFEVMPHDVASDAQRRVGLLAMMLPMLLAVWGATGGMHLAVDLTAGERERGTLEALMAVPVSRLALVVGKYLLVLLSAVFAQFVSVMGFALGFMLMGLFADDTITGGMSLTWQTAGGLLVAAVVLSAIFAAVELALALRSRSVREAQSYQAPITFGAMLPWLSIAFVAPADVPGYAYYLPIVSSVALFRDLVLGIFRPDHLIPMVLTGGTIALLVLRSAARRFATEEVGLRN